MLEIWSLKEDVVNEILCKVFELSATATFQHPMTQLDLQVTSLLDLPLV